MIYAVIDTNVIVSALLTHNPLVATAKVLDFLSEGRIVPVYNEDIIHEYHDVLHRRKFHFKFPSHPSVSLSSQSNSIAMQ